ncbi:MAG TPA: nuclear transport factor 2 family protein [Chthoniobacterales bacterium]|nr:nuclear transport factor 2 family protein [Chthoniobacterales bacterium]
MKPLIIALLGLTLTGSALPTGEEAPDPQIVATVQNFHDALQKGDRAAVMALLAPDAQILEGGHAESREEYEKGHLASDIEFAQAVPSTREHVLARQEGSVAWVTSSSCVSGTFKGRDVNSAGAELIVLSRAADGWRIRAIHWSSHALKK